MKNDRVLVFDTTLRDGEQCPGASLNPSQKLEVARQLARLGVDVLEAGFPIASPGDFNGVQQIAREIRGPVICGLARALEKDIDACAAAVKPAARRRIHTFLATSPVHMKYKLRMSPEKVLDTAVAAVKYARRRTDDIEFSPEDASRSEFDFLCRVVEKTIAAGARTINIPDTVGYAIPSEFGELIRRIIERVPNSHKAVISVHCHNDLGLAVANSLAAVANGARQVEGAMNGLGERAGNAAIEEMVMALQVRARLFGIGTGIHTEEIIKTSRLVSSLTGMVVQRNKAVVGENAFAHESGIHQHGMMAKRSTYEIMTPQSVGLKTSQLVLGKHSGRHAFQQRLAELGIRIAGDALVNAFQEFKVLADKKKFVYDEDLLALAKADIGAAEQVYNLDYLHTSSGSKTVPTATVRLRRRGQTMQEAACGDGPVDAAFMAINKLTGVAPRLLDYGLRAVSAGTDALGEVTVRVEYKGQTISARGASTDIIEASVKAYLNAVNLLLARGGAVRARRMSGM